MPVTKNVRTKQPLWKENDMKANKSGQHKTVYAINGDNYNGEWENNRKNGKGTQFWKKNGAIYDGDWVNDLRHGYGTYSLPNTSGGGYRKVFAGHWKDDKKHGHGTFYYPAVGRYYEGEWSENKRSGWGRMYYEDGAVYEGEWLNDQRNGSGMMRFRDENRYEGSWKDDMKHGDGKYFYLDKGQLLLGTWVKDIAKCGEMKDFNRDIATDATQYPIPELKMVDSNEVLEKAREWFKSSS